MIEAHIICCRKCEIRDLGLTMLPGQEQWVSEVVAGNSEDLRAEQRKGNVRVYRRTRPVNREPKRPPPPFVVRSRPQVREREEPRVIQKVIEKVVEVVETKVDTEEVARQVRGALLGDMREIIAEEMSRLLEAQATPQRAQATPPTVDAAALESALEAVLGRLAGAVALPVARTAPPSPDRPLYLPENLVDKDAKVRIRVSERAQDEGADLDDAADALRKFKKRHAGKTKESEES